MLHPITLPASRHTVLPCVPNIIVHSIYANCFCLYIVFTVVARTCNKGFILVK